jgi:hypothetical protein
MDSISFIVSVFPYTARHAKRRKMERLMLGCRFLAWHINRGE